MIEPLFTLQLEEPVSQIVVPETLTQCRCHYVPPVKEHINCPDFGKSDGTNGSCWWCMEMTPYQWHMCSDETWLQGLLRPTAKVLCKTREEAAKFIEDYKQKNPMGNERRSLISESETGKTAYKKLNVGHRSFCSNCGELAVMERYCSRCGAQVISNKE